MILKSYRYLSAYNEYCQVNVEEAYIKMKMMIGNRESGTGNGFLDPFFKRTFRIFQNYKIGNRD